jgi:DNA (cytosine-5)-methyltransferase 1
MGLRFIDLFAGIGGFHLAFHQAGGTCVFASEIDPHARESYERNFKGDTPSLFEANHFAGDITQVAYQHIPDFDVLCAGFPCQPFSICGQKKGFEDTRGTLFFTICEIIQAKQPAVVLLENVKHLLHHDGGRTFQVILDSLASLGYHVRYEVLNAVHFGTPQNRERIIIMATREVPFDFGSIVRHTRPTQKTRLLDILEAQGEFDYLPPETYTILESPTCQEQSGLIFAGYRNKNIRTKGTRPNTEHLSRVHKQPNRIYSVEGTHPTLPSQEVSGRFFIYYPHAAPEHAVRRLTLRECYRLMGYPDTFQIHERKSEAYKQVGNSVCVPIVRALAEAITLHLSQLSQSPPSPIANTYASAFKPLPHFKRSVRPQSIFELIPEPALASMAKVHCS